MAITVLGRGVVMPLRLSLLSTTMLSGVVGAVFLPVLTVQAADLEIKAPAAFNLPAVDGINWKAEGFGGVFANKRIAGSKGSLSVPLGGQFGVQLDGAIGSLNHQFFGSAGRHLLMRKPA